MTQRRYWNFKDDDATNDINRWLLGILPKGLYYGFDFVAGPTSWDFKLTQATTGQKETDDENTLTAFIGKYIMPQGVVVYEDDDIALSISAADPDDDRIDLVVATLDYIETEGGAEVQYSIIEGGPGDGVPALPFPEKQIILGQILIHAGDASTDDVTYTKPAYLFLGNRPDNFAYIDRNQVWNYIQSFAEVNYLEWGMAILDGTVLTLPTKSNLVATTVTGDFDGIGVKPEGTPLKVYFAFDCRMITGGNLKLPGGVAWPVKAGDIAEFVYYDSEGGWVLTVPGVGDLARKSQPNKFLATNTSNSGSVVLSGTKVGLTNNGNVFYVGAIATVTAITTLPDETVIEVRFASRTKLSHNVLPDSGYSQILCPYAIPLIVLPDEYLILLHRSGSWVVIGGRYTYRRNVLKRTVIVN